MGNWLKVGILTPYFEQMETDHCQPLVRLEAQKSLSAARPKSANATPEGSLCAGVAAYNSAAAIFSQVFVRAFGLSKPPHCTASELQFLNHQCCVTRAEISSQSPTLKWIAIFVHYLMIGRTEVL
jgi:hypothetical protein